MKMRFSKRIFAALLISSQSIFAMDQLAPTTAAPNGLDSMKIPQLLVLGFDDNRFDDGVRWVVDTLLGGRNNPAGLGNPATFDGTPLRATFYVISNADQWGGWRHAYDHGCEISNHTVTHEKAMYDENYDSHINELGQCSKYIINELGIPEVRGFRTPYLAFQPAGLTFKAAKDLGMIYDCSVENGTQSSDIQWTRPNFPWTLDKTITAISGAGSTPGLWEIPHVNFIKKTEQAAMQKGFDSGLWPTGADKGLNLRGPQMLEYLQGTLDLHYGKRKIKYSWETDSTIAGNRAPMDIGLHSDYYSVVASDPKNPDHNPQYLTMASTVQERRKALKDFVDYALTLPDVRIVTMYDIVRWMQNPTRLDDLTAKSLYEYTKNKASANLLSLVKTVNAVGTAGSSIVEQNSTANTRAFTATIDNNSSYVAGRKADLKLKFGSTFEGVNGITVTYSSAFPLMVSFEQSDLAADKASYYFTLPATVMRDEDDKLSIVETKTVTIPVSSRTIGQPYWNPKKGTLNLALSDELVISPLASDTLKTGKFTLNNIQVFGSDKFGGGTVAVEKTPTTQKDFRMNVVGSSVEFQAASSGVYQLELFTANGRMISQATHSVAAGPVSLPLQSVAPGAYILRIGTQSMNATQRVIIK